MQIGGGFVRLALGVSAASLVLGATWTEIGAGLPRTPVGVGAVVADPLSPSTLYALARSLFKSTDGGGTWNVIRNTSSVSALVIDPSDSSKLYAVDLGTVVKSTDGGQSWTNTGTGPGISALAIDPRSTSTLYAMSSTAILKTTDGGTTWSPKTMGLPPLMLGGLYGGLFGGSFALDPVNPSTIFAAVGNGLYKSTDEGESWRGPMVQSGACRNCPVAIDPAHPSIVYAVLLTPGNYGPTIGGDPTNLFKSTDGGENWKLANPEIPPDEVVSLVVDGASAVYISYAHYAFNAATSYGLAKSTDGGAKWNNINTGLPLDASYSLALNAADPSTIFAIGRGGVFRTMDGGAHWSLTPSAGLSVLDVHALAIDPVEPSTIYVASGDGVSKRIGGGSDWTTSHFPAPFGGTALVPSLLIDPNNPTALYASVLSTGGCSSGDSFLRKSTDGGATWNDLTVTSCADGPVSFVVDPGGSNTLYVAPYDDADCGTPLDMTTDGGTSWNQTYIRGFVTALAAGPGNPPTLYAGLTYSGGVLKSADEGKTWVNTGLRDVDVNVLALDPRNSNTLYAGTSMGLIKTTDGGATWSAINSALAGVVPTSAGITALVIDPKFSILYMGTSGAGVLRSIDGGKRWTAINDGLPNLNVRALAVSSDGSGTIYAATSAGVFTAVDQQEGKHRTVR
jgi:photosystem II stability/assembly factor-like uncharacterized protein